MNAIRSTSCRQDAYFITKDQSSCQQRRLILPATKIKNPILNGMLRQAFRSGDKHEPLSGWPRQHEVLLRNSEIVSDACAFYQHTSCTGRISLGIKGYQNTRIGEKFCVLRTSLKTTLNTRRSATSEMMIFLLSLRYSCLECPWIITLEDVGRIKIQERYINDLEDKARENHPTSEWRGTGPWKYDVLDVGPSCPYCYHENKKIVIPKLISVDGRIFELPEKAIKRQI